VIASAETGLSHTVRSDHDIAASRQLVRRIAQELGFSLVDQTKLVTATSELARNTVKYGGGGEMHIEVVRRGEETGLRITFTDQGPGISDIELAMSEGWTSGSGLGLGLSGSKRLVNDFHIESKPGEGTRVTIARWRRT
jgi:serine/threonine-protein kinase RsbT